MVWGHLLVVVVALWVLGDARWELCLALTAPLSQSALLAELFLEEGDGAVSLQSRRSSGPRVTGRPSRRSLPSSQKSKKSISSQVQGVEEMCAGAAPRGTHMCPGLGNPPSPRMLLPALTPLALSSAVQSLPEAADGDAGRHHAALHPLHQTQ